MKKQNIFWIANEGNRAFPGNDNYGQLSTYKKMAPEGILFTNAIASATSTIMSTSSFFSGRFSYELYYAHAALKQFGNHQNYLTLLKENNYTLNGIFFCKEGMNFYKDILSIEEDKKEFKSKNIDIWNYFLFVMKNKFDYKGNNFVYVHLAPHSDQEEYTKKLYTYLKENNLYEDSIIINSSDHGYTDYGKIHGLGWLMNPRNHSIYVSEDCYGSNLFIKLPSELSKVKNKIINTQVGLFDVFETIFDYIKLESPIKNKIAISLKNLIENDENKEIINNRLVRIDNRYISQPYKKTVIRNNNYELLIDHDKITFYKRINHKDWKKRLIKIRKLNQKQKNILFEFWQFYKKTEKEAKETTLKVLEENYQTSEIKKEIDTLKNKKIMIYNYSDSHMLKFLINKLKENNEIVIKDYRQIKKDYKKYDLIFIFVSNPLNYGFNKIMSFCKKHNINNLITDVKLKKLKLKKHSIIKHSLSNWRAYVGKNFIEKAIVFTVLSFLQIQDMFRLRKVKKHYLFKDIK